MSPQGIVPALNTAAKMASGSIIARMDADDIMHPKRLSEQVSFLDENSEVGLIGSCFRHFSDAQSGSIPKWVLHHEKWSNRISTQKIFITLFLQNRRLLTHFCMRKEVFDKLGGYHDSPWAEDYDFLHRARIEGFILGKVALYLLTKV